MISTRIALGFSCALALTWLGCGGSHTTAKSGSPQSEGEPEALVEQIAAKFEQGEYRTGLERSRILAEEKLSTRERTQLIELVDELYEEKMAALPSDDRLLALRVPLDLDAKAAQAYRATFLSILESNSYAAEVKYLLQAYVERELSFVAPFILDLYSQMRAHEPGPSSVYNEVAEAMFEHPDARWVPALVEKLKAPMVHPQMAKSDEQKKEYALSLQDQMFWQVVAAKTLGSLRSEAAIDPLFRVLLAPAKSPLVPTSLLALVEIGPPSQSFAAAALRGDKPGLEEYADAKAKALGLKPPKDTLFDVSAAVLGMGGLPSSEAILLEQLNQEPSAHQTVVLARELPKVSQSAKAKQALRDAFESLDASATLSARSPEPAKGVLADAATHFFDPDMVPWLADQAAELQAAASQQGGDKAAQAQFALLFAAFKLALPDQLEDLRARTVNLKLPPAAAAMLALAQQCGEEAECHLQQVVSQENQDGPRQFGALKAATLVAILGGQKEKMDLLRALPRIENPAVHFAALQAIEHLSPEGDLKAAKMLREQVKALRRTKTEDAVARVTPMLGVVGRLESRARWAEQSQKSD